MIYVTTGTRDEALKIARAVVDEQLAACANILGQVDSIYRWQGKVEETQEVVVVFKTRKDLVAAAIARIKTLHSYDLPCAVAYDMSAGLPQYLSWIDRETA
jgi:periplasmic divalent cation tolerance protein